MIKISRADKKKLRAARKKLAFERKREKIAAKNRRPKYIFCFACAGTCLASFFVCLSVLAQLYADFKYQTSASKLDIPAVTGPCYLRISIGYQGAVPEKITLSNNGGEIPRGDVEITDDPKNKTLVIGYDAESPVSDNYGLSVWPGDNFELKYEISREPSYKYMKYELDAYAGPDGDLWLDAACSFERVPGDISISIRCRGDKYAPVLLDAALGQNVKYELDLSEIARRKNIDLSRVDAVMIALVQSSDNDNGPRARMESIELYPESWPGYDPNAKKSYSMSDTDRIIS